ncbi:2-keto-4-pentenoate hydratase [Variovorax sp. dw_308]|uniref:2-keto-4-pentenoate hydratase n=1 Tax=Variovorax sp. dw_308 TaxID=2721546 RepID=UPI00352916D7
MNMKHTLAAAVAVALGTALASGAQAECMSDADVAAMAAAMVARTPAPNPPQDFSEADASCTRAKLNKLLLARYGTPIGYKAGLTNASIQKRFGYDKPVWGVLYQGMVLDNGATVDAAFGARPLYEADLLVRVRSDAINRAKTAADVMAAIDQIVPFIELADLTVQSTTALNGPGVTAINAGARLGVKGLAVLVPQADFAQAYLLDALRDMTVRITDSGTGAELARGKGSDILGQPLESVVWLADALAREGLAMRPGDLISLGSFSPLLTPRAGQSVQVSYDGLPGAQSVAVNFR